MYQDYKENAQFYMVYIKEAHPVDGWAMSTNENKDIYIKDPTTLEERNAVAVNSCTLLNLTMPCLVDDMTNTANELYDAWPDRLFVIEDGKIVVAGGPGPFGFSPSVQEAENWLAQRFDS